MAITALSILKAYFTCNDEVVKNKYYNILESFYHKSEGKLVTKYEESPTSVQIVLTGDEVISIPLIPSEVDTDMLLNLQTLLDDKVDNVAGKQLSVNDFTDELRLKLNNLENYVHPETHQISEVEGLTGVLESKVNQQDGKGLTSNDYTDEDKQKLDMLNLPIASETTSNIIYLSDQGNDSTAEIGNIEKPFASFSSAIAVKPVGQIFNFVPLTNFTFDTDPTSETIIKTDRRVTLDFSNLSGRLGAGQTMIINAPNANFIHLNTGNHNAVNFRYVRVFVDVHTIKMSSSSGQRSHLIEAGALDGDSYIRARKIILTDGGGSIIRGFALNINVFVEYLEHKRDYLVNSDTVGKYYIKEINSTNNEFKPLIFNDTSKWDEIIPMQPKIFTGGNIRWDGVFDASKSVILSGNVLPYTVLTGAENTLNQGGILIRSVRNFKIVNFYGSLTSRLAGQYVIEPQSPSQCNIQVVDSKITCNDDFIFTPSSLDYSSASFLIRNVEIEFTRVGREIFHDINPAGITVKKTGFLSSNGALGDYVNLTDNLSNSY